MGWLSRSIRRWEEALAWRHWQEQGASGRPHGEAWLNSRRRWVRAQADLFRHRERATSETWNQALMEMAPSSRDQWQRFWSAWQQDGVHQADRSYPWTKTVFVPIAVWEAVDAENDNPYRDRMHMARHGAKGYAPFMAALQEIFKVYDQTLQEMSIWTAAHEGPMRARVGMPLSPWKLRHRGQPSLPYEHWGVLDRTEHRLGAEVDWIRVGLLPVELMAASMEGLIWMEEVLRGHLLEASQTFNQVHRHVGLPLSRDEAMAGCESLQLDLWWARVASLSEQGRGTLRVMVHQSPERVTAMDLEAKLIFSGVGVGVEQLVLRQLHVSLHPGLDVEKILGRWRTHWNEQLVTHWLTVKVTDASEAPSTLSG